MHQDIDSFGAVHRQLRNRSASTDTATIRTPVGATRFDLAQKSADAKYRQKIVDDYRDATDDVIPLEQAVNYART